MIGIVLEIGVVATDSNNNGEDGVMALLKKCGRVTNRFGFSSLSSTAKTTSLTLTGQGGRRTMAERSFPPVLQTKVVNGIS